MGQEIVYCFRCQLRLTGADIESGRAIRASNKVCCVKCLTPQEKEALEKQRQKQSQTQPRGRKKSSSTTQAAATGPIPRIGGTTRRVHGDAGSSSVTRSRVMRDPTASTSSRNVLFVEPKKKSNVGLIIGLVGGGVVLLVVVLAIALSSSGPGTATNPGDPDPTQGGNASSGGTSSGNPNANLPPNPALPKNEQAKQLLLQARSFAQSNPDKLAEAKQKYEDLLWKYDGTPAAAEARREIQALSSKMTAGFDADLTALEKELAGPLAAHNFSAAQAIIERARPRHNHPQWRLAVDRIEDESVEKKAVARLDALMDECDRALQEKKYDVVRNARNEIAGWGPVFRRSLERFDEAYGAILAGVPSGTPPNSAGTNPPKPETNPKPEEMVGVAGADPKRSEAGRKYLGAWEKAMIYASRRDFNRAGAELLAAGGSIQDEQVRKENGDDIALIEKLKNTYTEMLADVAKLPAGEKITFGMTCEDGSWFTIKATVLEAGPNRLRLDSPPGFVEYVDLNFGALAKHFKKQRGDLSKEAIRTLGILCTLEGNEAAAEIVLDGKRETLPRKFWDYAAIVKEKLAPADPVQHKNDWAARRLFYAAEDLFASPLTRGEALGNYQKLLDTYAATPFVKRCRSEIAARIDAAAETALPAILLVGNGIFKTAKVKAEFKRKDVELEAWTSQKEPDAPGLQHNVEFEFYAQAGKEYKGWVLLGGCCKATFTWFLQGTELTHYDRKSRQEVACDPSGTAAAPWDHRIRSPISHGGRDHSKEPKKPTIWAWAELPMPKYATAGIKKFRLIGLSQGMAVGAVLISPTRDKPFDEFELKDFITASANITPPGSKKPEEWLVLGPFQTGNLDDTLPPDNGIKMAYAKSVKKGPKEWKQVKVKVKDENGASKVRVDFKALGVGGDNRVAYAMIHIYSLRKRQLKLHYLHDDDMKLYVNDAMIKKEGQNKSGTKTFVVTPGWNRVLFKIKNGGGDYVVEARFTDTDDKPVNDLRFSAKGKLR